MSVRKIIFTTFFTAILFCCNKNVDSMNNYDNYKVPTESDLELLKHLYFQTDEKVKYEMKKNIAMKKRYETVKENADKLKFILLIRKKLEFIETYYSSRLPNFNNFSREIIKLNCYKNVSIPERYYGKYFNKWLWMLGTTDPIITHQLQTLRKLLHFDPDKYIQFSKQIQRFRGFFNEDFHEGRMFGLKYINKTKINDYLSFLNPQIQEALKQYLKSEKMY